MTDRELLELAAMSYGLEGYIHEWINGPEFVVPGENPVTFNPLTDDGDALRLAVALGISFQYYRNAPPELGLPRECAVAAINGSWYAEAAAHGDWDAATRRAITRAAAQIQLNKEAANE